MPIAIAINATTAQAAQVVGYLAGAALATAISPQAALVVDVLTFAVVGGPDRHRAYARGRPPRSRDQRTHLLRESARGLPAGLRPARRCVRSPLLVFVLTMFAIVPEGLAAAWAAQGDPDAATRGLDQGLIMAAGPIGFVIGGLLTGRLARRRAARPADPAAGGALRPGPGAGRWSGRPRRSRRSSGRPLRRSPRAASSPTLNSKFVLILPHGFRARAYGVMQTGMQLSQFAAVMAPAGWPTGSGCRWWSGCGASAGTVVMVLLVGPVAEPTRPSGAAIEEAAAATRPRPARPPARGRRIGRRPLRPRTTRQPRHARPDAAAADEVQPVLEPGTAAAVEPRPGGGLPPTVATTSVTPEALLTAQPPAPAGRMDG